MKKEDLFENLSNIDDEYVTEARKENKPKKPMPWIKWAAMAACLALCIVAAVGIKNKISAKSIDPATVAENDEDENIESHEAYDNEFNDNEATEIFTEESAELAEEGYDEAEEIGAVTTKDAAATTGAKQSKSDATATKAQTTKKNTAVTTTTNAQTTKAEFASEPNWDEMSIPGRFNSVTINGKEYVYCGSNKENRYSTRKATLLSENKEIKKTYQDKDYSTKANIYTLEGFDKNLVIGVKFAESEYPHPYVNYDYSPSTLEEMKTAIDWDNTVTYGNISAIIDGVKVSVPVNKSDVRKYLISTGNAKNEKNKNMQDNGKYVSFTINCEELNIWNKTFRVYENGYISTNLVGYNYVFNIGKDNAAAFLKATCNSTFANVGDTVSMKGAGSSNDTTTTFWFIP